LEIDILPYLSEQELSYRKQIARHGRDIPVCVNVQVKSHGRDIPVQGVTPSEFREDV